MNRKNEHRHRNILPKDDIAYAFIGRYFKLTLITMFIYFIAYALFQNWHDNFLPFTELNVDMTKYIGLVVLLSSLVWTVIAPGHMKNSWRIGIDKDT